MKLTENRTQDGGRSPTQKEWINHLVMKTVIRMVPKWEQELSEELREVVEEKAREQNIDFRFLNDSKAIDESIRQIRQTMSRLERKVNYPEPELDPEQAGNPDEGGME